jgi:hypothetical protein
MSHEEQKDVYDRLSHIERKIDMIIAMIEMKNREVNKEEYLAFVNSVQERKFIPDQVLFDDDNDTI